MGKRAGKYGCRSSEGRGFHAESSGGHRSGVGVGGRGCPGGPLVAVALVFLSEVRYGRLGMSCLRVGDRTR